MIGQFAKLPHKNWRNSCGLQERRRPLQLLLGDKQAVLHLSFDSHSLSRDLAVYREGSSQNLRHNLRALIITRSRNWPDGPQTANSLSFSSDLVTGLYVHASGEAARREKRGRQPENVSRAFSTLDGPRKKTLLVVQVDRSLRCSQPTHRLNRGLVSATQARRTGHYKRKELVFS